MIVDTTLKLVIYEYLLRNTIKYNTYTFNVLARITYLVYSHIRNRNPCYVMVINRAVQIGVISLDN